MTDFRTAPFRDAEFMPVDLAVRRSSDGTIIFQSKIPIPPHDQNIARAVMDSIERNSDKIALAERGGDGAWIEINYREFGKRIDRIAGWLIDRVPVGRAVMVISENSIDAAAVSFACHAARVIHTPVSPAFAMTSDYTRLRHVAETTWPACIFAAGTAANAAGVEQLFDSQIPVLTDNPAVFDREVTAIASVYEFPTTGAVRASVEEINPQEVSTYMMTSGSTGLPKVVQQSMAALAASTAQSVAAIGKAAGWDDVMLDWLPWHHAAGAAVLRTGVIEGGSLYIDAGKPVPGLINKSIENLREISVRYFNNVPSGYAMLVDAMEQDAQLKMSFFSKMRLMLYGGAGLPQAVYDRLQEMAVEETGHRIHMTTGYGMTESISGCLTIHYPTQKVGIGLPSPGVSVKLVPTDDRYEVRLKGANLMEGYLGAPDQNAEAFDDDGYYRTGDLARLINPDSLDEGLAFAGRLAEEFKLDSGAWVYTGEVRDALLKALAPDVADMVLCDTDRPFLTAMFWPKVDANPERISKNLKRFNANRSGKSATIKRYVLLADPPNPAMQEVSDKGTINRRAVLKNRADILDSLYADSLTSGVNET